MIRSSSQLISSLWVRQGMASFATQPDYLEVMKTATEIVPAVETPAKEVGLCAGVPLETLKRKVRIFSPARTASQSGQGRTTFNSMAPAWKIAFATFAKWENPLMGWTSTADPLENVARSTLQFYTPEEAAAFCEKHGWEYEIEHPKAKRTMRQKRYLGYGDNFSVKRKGAPDLSTLRGNRAPAPPS